MTSKCECPTSAALLLYPCCLLSIAPGPWRPNLTRGITITNYHKLLSPLSAILAPVPHTPHSGSEAPRGPQRNRTIFSPGQAEALEKGAGPGWTVGQRLLSVTYRGNVPEACGPRWRGGGCGGPIGSFRIGAGGEWGLWGRPMPCFSPHALAMSPHLCRVPAWAVS